MCPIGHLSDGTFLKKNGKCYYTITGTKLNQVEKTSNSTGKIVVLTTHHTNYYKEIIKK
jgi:hypothetical protein